MSYSQRPSIRPGSFRHDQPSAAHFHRQSSHGSRLCSAFDPGRTRIPGSAVGSGSPPVSSVGAIDLPPATLPDRSFRDLIADRHSRRDFGGPALELGEISTLLEAAYGYRQTGDDEPAPGATGNRPVPSAGASYRFELYALVRRVDGIPPGVYRYEPRAHRLSRVRGRVPWGLIVRLFFHQPWLAEADLILASVARLPISVERYGERSYRYALFEAGHIAQNLVLGATACGFASLPLGGFEDLELSELLDLDPELELPLYCAAFGHPRSGDPGPPSIGESP